MSEERDRRPLEGAGAEDSAQKVEGAQEKQDGRENAPRGERRPRNRRGGRRRRRRSGVALPLMSLFLVAALVCGLAVGYSVGRSGMMDRLRLSEAEVSRLTVELDELRESSGADAAEAAAQNQAALDELAGVLDAPDDGNAMLMGGDALLDGGEAQPSSEAEATVVAEYDGGELLSGEVAQAYDERITSYVFSGYSEEDVASTVIEDVMRELITERLLVARAQEMGLYENAQEDQAQIEEAANAQYDEELDYYRSLVRAEGASEADVQREAEARLLEAEGVSYETVLEETSANWWREKLYDALTQDVQLDEAELQAAYDERLAEQRERFAASADEYELSQMNGEVILYNLEGYRAVKLLRLDLDYDSLDRAFEIGAALSGLDEDVDAEEIDAYRAQQDEIYASVEARAQGALDEMASGASFDELIERYGADEGMRDAELRATGYYLTDGTQNWPEEMVEAAMALSEPGEVSGIIRLEDGVCVLQYIGEVAAGEVALDDVRERLMADTLEERRDAAYDAQIDVWLDEANVRYYPERMQ